MREDMAKVIVERPRKGGGYKYPRHDAFWQRTPPEDWPKGEPVSRLRYPRHKWLNENLAPLERFLRSRCGQPWSKVYSEICERINRNSAVQLHVWQHLMEFVCVNTMIRHGTVCDSKGNSIRGFWRRFYVHPTTQLLCYQEHEPKRIYLSQRRNKQIDPNRIRISDLQQFRRIGGIWYRIHFAPLPPSRMTVWDVLFRKTGDRLSGDEMLWVNGSAFYANQKLQIGKREIRRHRLNVSGSVP